MAFATLEDLIGNTPLLALRRINPYPDVTLLVKLEGNNPAGSVKDRPAPRHGGGGQGLPDAAHHAAYHEPGAARRHAGLWC